MNPQRADLRTVARQLLESGRVKAVIGHTAGTVPLGAAPLFCRAPEETSALMFDPTCGLNLVKYLHRFKGAPVAIVVKGCDELSVVGLIQEKQVQREQVVLLGAPCEGVIDPAVVRDRTQDDSFREAAVEGGNLVVTTSSGRRHVLPVMEVRHAACRRCPVRNPRFADYLVGDPVSQEEASGFSGGEMERLSAAGTEERWAAFRREMGKCILCMACRNLCPACYCADCFAESTQPRWLTRGSDESDAMFFHLSRLTHLAGRCTGCGACARGCPVGVRLEVYYDRLRKDVKEVFGFEAGLDPRAEPPLTCFRQDDENAFIM